MLEGGPVHAAAEGHRPANAASRGAAAGDPARAFLGLVCGAGMVAATAPAGPPRQRRRRPLYPPDRADRRRKDARRLPAEPRFARRAQPEDAAAGRRSHALRLAAEGAGGRHRPERRAAGGGDGPSRPPRDPHRRHAAAQAHPPAPRSAGHAADDARTGGAPPRFGRRGADVLEPSRGDLRRTPFAGDVEARRSPVARPRTPQAPRAGPRDDRPVRHRGGAGRSPRVAGAADGLRRGGVAGERRIGGACAHRRRPGLRLAPSGRGLRDLASGASLNRGW